MRKRLDDLFPEPAKMETYDDLLKIDLFKYRFQYVSNSGLYSSAYSRNYNDSADTREKIIARRDALFAILDNVLPLGDPIRARNAERIVHNKAIHEKIGLLMTRMGVKKYCTTEYVRRKPKSIAHDPGYIGDLNRAIPLMDNYSVFKHTIDNQRAEIKRWADTRLATIDAEVQARAEAEKDARRTQYLATMRVRYNLAYDADADQVLEAILDQSPHLKFAHWLYRNRCNSNDGPHYARVGMDGFNPLDDRDREIYQRVAEKVTDWDGDGRIFRNDYTELFGIASERANEASLDYDAYREFHELDY